MSTYYELNKEKILAQQKEYRKNNPEKRKSIKRNYYAANKEIHKEWAKKWKKKWKEANPEWRWYNPEKKRAAKARRRATKLNATPAWQDSWEITTFYVFRPNGYHVDHIIPLKHDLVCGLHVLSNLQYLPAKDNLSKGNNFKPHRTVAATGECIYID